MMKLKQLEPGTVVHWTNWPGRASVPVTVVREGNIRFADGRVLTAFDDEVFTHPVSGLEHAGASYTDCPVCCPRQVDSGDVNRG